MIILPIVIHRYFQPDLRVSQKKHPFWDEAGLVAQTQDLFTRFQNDWSKGDGASMKSYVTEPYLTHLTLLMKAERQLRRRNKIIITKPLPAVVWKMAPSFKTPKVLMQVNAVAESSIESDSGDVLFSQKVTVCQYWTLVYVDRLWQLEHIDSYDNITPLTPPSESDPERYQVNGMFRSWFFSNILLPEKGYIFPEEVFEESIVTNHSIGEFNDVLIQMYDYEPGSLNDTGKLRFLVTQTVLPKKYGHIMLLPRTPMSAVLALPSLEEFTSESIDFGDKYDIYARADEARVVFELFNPSFISNILDAPFKCGLEVIDNHLYIFVLEQKGPFASRKRLLSLIQQAWKELRA